MAFPGDNSDSCNNTEMYLLNKTDHCEYVKNQTCHGDSIANFYQIFYCSWDESLAVAIIVSIPMFLYIFILLMKTTQNYLAPALTKLAHTLKLSENLAGVTLLALSNGAQDLATNIVAAFREETSDESRNPIYMAIGGFIGAAVFINLVITSIITLRSDPAKPIQMPKRTFLKDVLFLQLVMIMLVIYGIVGQIDAWMACTFFILYFVYVFTTGVYMREDSSEIKAKQPAKEIEGDTKGSQPLLDSDKKQTAGSQSKFQLFIDRLINAKDRSKMNLFQKIFYYIVELPCNFLLSISIPPPDEENWSPLQACLSPVFGALLIFIHREILDSTIGPSFPLVVPVLIICAINSVVIYLFTRVGTMHFVVHLFSNILSLVMAVFWVWFLSDFVVDLLDIFGFVTEISSAFSGVTFLAWANSLGDLITDLSIAGLDLNDMAVTGTYASPTFNLMVGLPVVLLAAISGSKKGYIKFTFGGSESIILIFALIFLIIYNFGFIAQMHFTGYHMKRIMAYAAIGLFGIFCIPVAIMAYFTRAS